MEIKGRLIKGNNLFLKEIESNHELGELSSQLVKGQSPFCLVLTCSDSRVIPEKIFSCNLGELFVIRSAGNVINEGELASIEYGLEHLNIKYVVILAHTHCGAVHASIKNEKGRYMSCILDKIALNVGSCNDEKDAAIMNAKAQVKYLIDKFPSYDGEVVAALYDIETNKVEFYE